GQLAKPRRGPPPQAPSAHQPRPLQDFAGRRRRRPVRLRLARLELGDDLARPPSRTLAPQTHDRLRQMLRRRTAVRRRSARPLGQSRRPFRFIALEPLVAGLAADLVALAKLRHCPRVRSAIDNETHPLVHRTALSPGHRLVLPADRELSPIFPVRSVTYLSGPNKVSPSPRSGEGGRRPDGGAKSRDGSYQVRGGGRATQLGSRQRAIPHPALPRENFLSPRLRRCSMFVHVLPS